MKSKQKRIFLVCLIAISALFSQAQSKKISGVVTSDVEGMPLAGVNVTLKGSSLVVVTDSKGRYSLNLPNENAIIEFSYAGYIPQTVNTRGRATIDVVLTSDSKQLSDVVVTALGVKKQKRSLGYSIQEVAGSKLVAANETNVINALKGRIAGVQINSSSAGPGGSVYVAIRGNSSLGGNNLPLFVVDGIPINNDNLDQASVFGGRDYGDGVKDINPDDIESLSVLKGPNAAALYGSRGANGVILITTKKGTKRGLGVSYNSNATFEQINSIPTFQNKWGMGYDGDFSSWGTANINGTDYPQQASWMYDNWGGPMDGRLISIETLPDLGVVPYNPQPRNNIAKFYRTGQTFTNTVSVTSVTDRINFRASVSNLSNKGIVPNNSSDRQTIDLLIGANITDKLHVEAKANYIHQNTNNRPYLGASRLNITNSLNNVARHVNLDWLKDYKNPDGTMRSYRTAGFPMNPYWILNEYLNDDKRDRLIGYISADYQFTKWLNLKLRTSTDTYTDEKNIRIGQKSPTNLGGYISNAQDHVAENNSDLLLSASGKLSKNFTGSVSAGANHYSYRLNSTGAYGSNLDIDDLYIISNMQVQKGIYSLVRKEINSVYATGQLGYKDYLFLDLTARNDWSSSLSKGHYSFFYPSASLSYVMTDALKMQSDLLNYMKLRASWAQAGTDAAPYQTQAGYSVYTNAFNGMSFAYVNSAIPSANLKNELKTSWEIGTDMRLFRNRVSLDFTYYNSATTDQIMFVQIPSPTGFDSKLVNAGKVTNKGVELYLTVRPVQLRNSFTWDITANLSKNRSEIISLYPGLSTKLLYTSGDAAIEARPGHPYGDIVGLPFLKNDKGQLLLDANGMVQANNQRVVLGNIQPKWLGGFTNTFSFKGFVLSGLIDVRNGGQVYSYTRYDQTARGTGIFTENIDNLINKGLIADGNGGFKENTIALNRQGYWAMQAWSGAAEPFVLSASLVSLREVTLGYNFSPSFLSKIKITSARLSVVGRNLLYLYRDPMFKTMGVSPEAAFAPTAFAQGYEAANMPTTRSLGFSLNIGF